MNWNEALNLIQNNIAVGLSLDENSSNGRHVLAGPAHICNSYDFRGIPGYKIQIGSTISSYIEVPIEMLRNIFNDSILDNRIYNKSVFRIHYPYHSETATGHPCYVHVVGMIFVKAGVGVKKGKRNFRIL
ncbi:MAG: hypothetical protein IAE93_14225 [Ignavibacteria bacterium]|nr:hypothetical protein [Ignavibacteria bacterium]